MVKAVIFDVDGTLIDSVSLHARAWQEAFSHFGVTVGFDEVRSQIGKGGDQLLPVFLPKERVQREGEKIEKYRSSLFKEKYMPQVTAFAGVRELFRRVEADGKRIALASSAKADELEVYKQIARIDDLLDTETSSADAEKSKPEPDIFLAALHHLNGLEPADAIVIGDSPWDAEAARKAGMRCIGVRSGGFPDDALRQAGCTEIYHDPVHLLAEYERSLIVKG